MSGNNSHVMAAVAGGVGLAFVGYCIYFDRKRRSDPEFKRKLIESTPQFGSFFLYNNENEFSLILIFRKEKSKESSGSKELSTSKTLVKPSQY